MRADEARITELFANQSCSRGIYLDVGSNIGVQVRKLYEPAKYEGAGVLPIFEQAFGPSRRCRVCAIGFEPNPRHSARLNLVEHHLNRAGLRVMFFRAAAGAVDGEISLHFGTAKSAFEDAGASALGLGRYRGTASVQVRQIRLARILMHIKRLQASATPKAPLLMKLDIEGSEWTVIPDLMVSKSFCTLDTVSARLGWIPPLSSRPLVILLGFAERRYRHTIAKQRARQ